MKYLPAIIGAAVLVMILGAIVVYAYETRVRQPRALARWRKAKESARWTVHETREGQEIHVFLKRVAVLGHREEVLEVQFIGGVPTDRDDYIEQRDKLTLEALTQAYQLNTGPLS